MHRLLCGAVCRGADAASIEHVYQWGGDFSVTLTVTDGRGGTDTDTATASVAEANDVPVANAGLTTRAATWTRTAIATGRQSSYLMDGTTTAPSSIEAIDAVMAGGLDD